MDTSPHAGSSSRPGTHGRAVIPEAVEVNSRHLHRSRSLSPNSREYRAPKTYTAASATQYGVAIGPHHPPYPSVSQSSLRTTASGPAAYTSPFISTKSRPSLYHRATSESEKSLSAAARGRARSRSTNTVEQPPSPAAIVSAPSFASAMMPPFAPYNVTMTYAGDDRSSVSSRSSSRASTSRSAATTKRGFVARLKSLVKGEAPATESVVYMTPEEARERELRIKKTIGKAAITTGGLGI